MRMRLLFSFFLALLLAAGVQAQADIAEEIAAATVADDPGRTALQLDAVALRYPASAPAWLASARAWKAIPARQAEAEKAYRRHLALSPLAPRALYELAAVLVARGQRAEALATLRRAAATRRIDLSVARADPQFEALRGERDLDTLGHWDESLANGLVEGTPVLQEWRGEAAGDQFGWIARGIGDVDKDGAIDFVTSAPTARAGRGRVYVYSSRGGGLLWSRDGDDSRQFGTGIEAAGDTNGDGIPDVVACGPGSDGVAWLLSGSDGATLQQLAPPKAKAAFGNQCQGVGDVDGDAKADVIVGAPGTQADDPGHAYVFSGATGKLLHTLSGERAGDQFGSAVTGVTHNGRSLLIAGAPRSGKRNAGRVYVYDAARPARTTFVLEGDATSAAFGRMFLSVPGDANGDGVPDLYVSDWADTAQGPGSGAVYLFSGADGHRLQTWKGEHPSEGFGTTQAVLGDIDGDGAADLAVGTWQHSRIALGAGRVQVFSGRTGEALAAYTSRVPGDTFGFDAVGLGDVDGDGTIDLLITAAWSPVRGPQTGRILLLRGAPAPR